MTNTTQRGFKALLLGSVLAASPSFAQFDSGSTGEDGSLSPLVDTTIQLPEDGILNYTTVTIPTGVTLRFESNATNTPVVILATGNVTIDGSIDVSGGNATDAGVAGDGNLGDDGLPGIGGPGGFAGGAGGTITSPAGGNGLGPGGGQGGNILGNSSFGLGCAGAGAGFESLGARGGGCNNDQSIGQVYGDASLQPLIGGSGGGGGYAGTNFSGAGGGGGGGAILIASSETITVNGAIRANGGIPGDSGGPASGGVGGEGSGGAIRLVASVLSGEGIIEALDSSVSVNNNQSNQTAGRGSDGRIRLEAQTIERSSGTTPAFAFSGPEPVFLANIPGVRIASVAGIVTPASPSGAGDVVIPETTPNPVVIEFTTNNVPVGNTIELTLTPQSGVSTTSVSGAITGSDTAGTASVSVEIPDGPSTLSASVTFTIAVASNGELVEDYSRFAKGNAVEKVRIDFDPEQGSMTTFIAKNGEEYSWPSNTIAFN